MLITGDSIWNMLGRMTWPVPMLCTDAALSRRTAEVLGELDYDVAAFTHGPEIREDAREAVRGFLRAKQHRGRPVTKARVARRIAMAAAYGGGGLGVLSRRRVRPGPGRGRAGPPGDRRADREAPGRRRRLRRAPPGQPLRLLMLGDSSACGLGVDAPAPDAGRDARRRARGVRRPAGAAHRRRPRSARAAATCSAQIERVAGSTFDVAVVMIGANDVTHRVKPPTAVRHLDHAVRRLRRARRRGRRRHLPGPRHGRAGPAAAALVARRASRQLAAAQTIAVVEAGGRTVSLGDVLGPEFAASPKEMFGPDRFHPSAAGYAAPPR